MDITSNPTERIGRNPSLSVIIGIRNWGLDRLEVAIRSHRSSNTEDLEIVISDYGSDNSSAVRKIAERFGCGYVYTDADVWSRSAALNAGIRIASSQNILTTDGDIIFSPRSHEVLLSNLSRMPDSVQIIQCRDLPEGYGAEGLSSFDWDELCSVSSIRPRWGMGGSATFTRALFSRLHGFEERMTVWGGEDNDFVQRARRSGALLNWVEDPAAQIYHIWHAPDSRGASPAGAKTIEQNKKILQNDHTIVRNLSRSYRGSAPFVPTVSIVIPIGERPGSLRESLSSCLRQTFQDFELLVVSDGSGEGLRPILNAFDDKRIRLLELGESRGPGFARNCATALAQGEFITIHSDEDIMLPRRLERQLAAIIDDCAGSYGGSIGFDDQTGALTLNPGRRAFDCASMMFGRTPSHTSFLVRRRVLEHYRYNENFLVDSEYHLLNRIARAGIRLTHCGHYVVFRRIHANDPAGTYLSAQKPTAGISKAMARSTVSADRDHQLGKASRANPQAEMDLSEVIDAIRHLPPRLLAKSMRLEFMVPLPGSSDTFKFLASALASHRSITFEFDSEGSRGIVAVTIPLDDASSSQDDIASRFARIGTIASADEVVLPLAYPNLPILEHDLLSGPDRKGETLGVGRDIEGILRVIGKHCGRCVLSTGEDDGYRLDLPPLGPATGTLVRAKLGGFLTNGRRVDAEV
ncbi:glycosyltransferase family 2 protein [Microvirga lenta]|uniref:glycosyltransferase family 2 protein n=1 Tax=Microvirga lenta TaxID=2881337 RepID=UPI001D000116|nr:glycosyltransferase [Microvirga lenta]MCB5176426.1 glycosyltransferase [Microvirga lenta]